MKLLICQPKLEPALGQLEKELDRHPGVDGAIFPEGYLNENIEQACMLARRYGVMLIGGHRRLQERPKDRAIIINRSGDIVLDRIKYSDSSFVNGNGLKIGHILCDELIVQGLRTTEKNPDLIVHPIGVGMFSEEQFAEWLSAARKIAAENRCMMIGTSHADGSYGDTGISIPIAYWFDEYGQALFIAKNDVHTRIVDTETKEVMI